MTQNDSNQNSGSEERIREQVPAQEKLIDEAVTETENGGEVTTRVFRNRVEIITRDAEGGLKVEIMPMSLGMPR